MPSFDVYNYHDRSRERKRIEKILLAKGLVRGSSKFEQVLWRRMRRR